jgi:Ni/Co efflux regulator RcnB
MKRLLTSVIAVSLLSGLVTVAHADSRHHHRDDRKGWSEHHYDHKHPHGHHQVRYHRGKYQPPKGHRHHAWRIGERLPAAYRVQHYHVHDYWKYRLRPPPHGHYWVRVDNDVLLTAVATGLVVQVVNGLFY